MPRPHSPPLPPPPTQPVLPRRQAAWRRVVQLAVGAGIAVPGMTASLAYFDTYRRGRLPANLVQVGGGVVGGRAWVLFWCTHGKL